MRRNSLTGRYLVLLLPGIALLQQPALQRHVQRRYIHPSRGGANGPVRWVHTDRSTKSDLVQPFLRDLRADQEGLIKKSVI